MGLRITNGMIIGRFLHNLNNNNSRMNKIQMQVGADKRVLRLSDDPVGITKILMARSRISDVGQYERNIRDAESLLVSSETAMQDINQAVARLNELAVKVANEVVTPEDRQAAANEIRQLRDHIFSSLNSSISGRFLFGGHNVTSPPYTLHDREAVTLDGFDRDDFGFTPDGTQYQLAGFTPAAYGYNANDGPLFRISNAYVPLDPPAPAFPIVPRNAVFIDEEGYFFDVNGHMLNQYGEREFPPVPFEPTLANGAPRNTTHIDEHGRFLDVNGRVLDAHGNFALDERGDVMQDIWYNRVDIPDPANPDSFITVRGINLNDKAFHTGIRPPLSQAQTDEVNDLFRSMLPAGSGLNDIAAAVEASLGVSPDMASDIVAWAEYDRQMGQKLNFMLGYSVDIPINVVGLELSGVGPGNMWTTVDNFYRAMNHPEMVDFEYAQSFIKEMQRLQDAALANMADLGGRSNRLDFISDRYSIDKINYEQMLADVEGLDLAEAITRLSFAEATYRASLGIGGRILQPTLLDFLR